MSERRVYGHRSINEGTYWSVWESYDPQLKSWTMVGTRPKFGMGPAGKKLETGQGIVVRRP
jgi:hypothetical protein